MTRVLLLGAHPAVEEVGAFLAENDIAASVCKDLDALSHESSLGAFCVIFHADDGHAALAEFAKRHLALGLNLPVILLVHDTGRNLPDIKWPFVARHSTDRLDLDHLRRDIDLLRRATQGLGAASLGHCDPDARLKDLLDQLPDGILLIDKDDTILHANPAAGRLFGRAAQELVGEPFWRPLAEEDPIGIDIPCRMGDKTFEMRRGKTTWRGQPVHLAILRDISERKHIERSRRGARLEIDRPGRAKGDFLTKISHDIRTPLSGIIGMADLAMTKAESPPMRRHVEMIRRSAQSLLSILNDIIDLARMEAGKLELDSKPFRLREALSPILETTGNLCLEKGLTFTSHIASTIPEDLTGDSRRLNQILNSLLNNAIKFTGKGRIKFSADLVDQLDGWVVNGSETILVRFSIQDTGIGMSESLQKRIQNILTQGADAPGNPANGSGLHVVRQLVRLMGGAIEFNSLERVGSTFRVTLPFSMAGRQDKRQADAKQSQKNAAGPGVLSILLVEDNKVNQLFTKEMLLSEGHSVEVAENGQEALDILSRRRFDIVLMDIQMPVMDGVEATRRIRDAGSSVLDHDVPIVALTAHAIQGDRERFLKTGMNDYITKPVDFQKLFGTLAAILPDRKIVANNTPEPQPLSAKTKQASQAIDRTWLDNMLATRRDFLKRMFQVFVHEEPLRLEKTQKALESKDMEILRFLAHSIKGATATMGAYGAKERAAALEQAAKRQDLEDARRQYDLLAEEMSRVLDFMRGFLEGKHG